MYTSRAAGWGVEGYVAYDFWPKMMHIFFCPKKLGKCRTYFLSQKKLGQVFYMKFNFKAIYSALPYPAMTPPGPSATSGYIVRPAELMTWPALPGFKPAWSALWLSL